MLDFCTRSCILFSLSTFLDNILFIPYHEYMLRCLQPHWGAWQTYTCHLCPRCTKSAPKTLDLLAGSIRFSDGATQIGWNVANTFYSKTGQSRSPKQLSDMSVKRHVAKSRKISMDSARCFDFALQGLQRSLQLYPNRRHIHQINVVSSRTKFYFKEKPIGNF